MSRSLAAWTLLLTLLFSVGCGGGSSSTSGVAENSGSQSGSSASSQAMGGAIGMAPMGGPGSASSSSSGGSPGGPPAMMPGGPPGGMGPNSGSSSADPAAMSAYTGGQNPSANSTSSADPATMAAYAGGQARPDSAGGAPDPAAMAQQYGAGGYPGADARVTDAAGGAPTPGSENYGSAGTTPPGGESTDSAAGAINYSTPGAAGRGEAGAASAAFPGGYPGAEGTGEVAAKEPPKTLDGKARWSFEQGKERDGMAYWYGYGLTTDEGATQILGNMRWAPGLKRPALAIRWGTGVQLAVKLRGYEGDYKPIGSTQNLPTKGGSRGNDGGAEAPGSAPAYASAEGFGAEGGGDGGNPMLAKAAGELGERLLKGYRERLEQGDFGAILKDVPQAASGEGGGFESGLASAAGAYGASGAAMNPKAGPGGYPGMRGGSGGAGGAGGSGGAGGQAGLDVQLQILPGLTLLGMGSSKELIGKAKADGIDYLLLFNVSVAPNPKTQLIANDTTIEIYDVATNKKVHSSKTLNNIQVQRDRAENKDDGIEKEMERLFGVIDTTIKLVDMPAGLNETNVAARVTKLAAEHSPNGNPLPVLGEIRMYNVKGLLDEAKLTAACQQLAGPDLGRQLAAGTPEEREQAIRRWLPAE